MKVLLCFETVRPNKYFFDLCYELKNEQYDIYIFIDDNKYTIDFYYDNTVINVVYIDNDECESAGYKGLVRWMRNKASSKDKALYYIIKNNLEYDYVWFIEEDCFIPHKDTIINIDKKYQNYDLLCQSHFIYYSKPNISEWHWKYVFDFCKLQPPYGRSLMCALRCSKNLINVVKNHVYKYKTLFYCESIFNTLCLHNNLNVKSIDELKYMMWSTDKEWNIKKIKKEFIYHPIKDTHLQLNFRNTIK